jgi:hypothetical protein
MGEIKSEKFRKSDKGFSLKTSYIFFEGNDEMLYLENLEEIIFSRHKMFDLVR